MIAVLRCSSPINEKAGGTERKVCRTGREGCCGGGEEREWSVCFFVYFLVILICIVSAVVVNVMPFYLFIVFGGD